MTPEEIRRARRDTALLTDVQLTQLHDRGPDQWPPEGWEILKEELARRQSARGTGSDESPPAATYDMIAGGWLMIWTGAPLLVIGGLTALGAALQNELVFSILVVAPVAILLTLGLAVGGVLALVELAADPTMRTKRH